MNLMTSNFSKNVQQNITAATYTLLPSDGYIRGNCASNAIALTFPTATGSGREIWVKKTDTTNNAITCTSSGATFDGQSSIVITDPYAMVGFVDAATNVWDLI